MPDQVRQSNVHAAVQRDLQPLPAEVRHSALAEAALELARCLDRGYEKGSETAAVARELRSHMADLLANTPSEEDDVAALLKREAFRKDAVSTGTQRP